LCSKKVEVEIGAGGEGMNILSQLKRHTMHLGCVSLYLLCCFGIFSTLKKLTLAAYKIEWSALVPAVLGALVTAKVVLILEQIPLAARLDIHYPIWLAVLYKTFFYCAATVPVLFSEKMWLVYTEGTPLDQIMSEAWAHMETRNIMTWIIAVGLVFACYHLYEEIDRRLGTGTLRHLIFSRAERKVG
jgi:hypothetical protein